MENNVTNRSKLLRYISRDKRYQRVVDASTDYLLELLQDGSLGVPYKKGEEQWTDYITNDLFDYILDYLDSAYIDGVSHLYKIPRNAYTPREIRKIADTKAETNRRKQAKKLVQRIMVTLLEQSIIDSIRREIEVDEFPGCCALEIISNVDFLGWAPAELGAEFLTDTARGGKGGTRGGVMISFTDQQVPPSKQKTLRKALKDRGWHTSPDFKVKTRHKENYNIHIYLYKGY